MYVDLVEVDVGDDLGACGGVESAHDVGASGTEFLFEYGGLEFYVEGLVFDEGVAYVARDAVAQHFFQCLEHLELVVGGLQPFLAEELLNEGSYFFCITSSHLVEKSFFAPLFYRYYEISLL